MEKRDKELEMDNNYRQKLWNESLDQVNSNLVNMHTMLIELEGTMNNIGMRQDELITQVENTNDHCLFNREEPLEKEKPNISIPKFPPSLASFYLEPIATPEPDPTRLASPNRNPGDARLFLFIFRVIKFSFQKCRDPNLRPDFNGRSEPEPDLL